MPSFLNPSQTQEYQALQTKLGSNLNVQFLNSNGTASFISGGILESSIVPTSTVSLKEEKESREGVSATATDKATALKFLENNQALIGVTDPKTNFKFSKETGDQLGQLHLRYEQYFDNLRVWPAEVIVHLDSNHNVIAFNGTQFSVPEQISKDLKSVFISEKEAVKLAQEGLTKEAHASLDNRVISQSNPPQKIIYVWDGKGQKDSCVAWKVEITQGSRFQWLIVINAQTGEILAVINQVPSIHQTKR